MPTEDSTAFARLIIFAAALFLLGACQPKSGSVVAKEHVPERAYKYRCGCAMYTKVGDISICSIPITCDGVHPEQWIVHLVHRGEEKESRFSAYVPRHVYDKAEPGSWLEKADGEWVNGP